MTSTFISSLIPTPCAEDVVSNATLSCISKIGRFSLKDDKETIFEPVVLIKLELVRNKAVSYTHLTLPTNDRV